MPRRLTALEEYNLHLQAVFNDYVSIDELQALTRPPLARSTVVNAIIRMHVDAKMYYPPNGFYLIYLPSAMQLWPERFANAKLHAAR